MGESIKQESKSVDNNEVSNEFAGEENVNSWRENIKIEISKSLIGRRVVCIRWIATPRRDI